MVFGERTMRWASAGAISCPWLRAAVFTFSITKRRSLFPGANISPCWRLFICVMRVERTSPCKVNLVLNTLGKRPDGFHELETVMQPIKICDSLTFERRARSGIELTCSEPSLPADPSNLVYRAAAKFLEYVGGEAGIRLHLEKRIPLAAGLGGGSSNAA